MLIMALISNLATTIFVTAAAGDFWYYYFTEPGINRTFKRQLFLLALFTSGFLIVLIHYYHWV